MLAIYSQIFVVIIEGICLSSGFQHIYDVYSENWREKDCSKVLSRVKHERIDVPVPPEITGEWSSHRCEVRSGPEFLLRKYTFSKNRTFTLHQYYYSDPECNRPLYALVANGHYRYRSESWIVARSMDTDYFVTDAYIIPYTETAAFKFESRLSGTCLKLSSRKWKAFGKYQITKQAYYDFNEDENYDDESYVPDIDCMPDFHMSLNELQLIRLEIRWRYHRHGNKKSSKRMKQRELLVGSVHSDKKQRTFHRPNSFQPPLKVITEPGCHVCNRIGNSNDFYPPTLRPRHTTFANLIGDWVSTRCESREHGMFLTRWIKFLDNGHSFEAMYDYYFDPLCRDASFSLHAKGSYGGGEAFSYLHGSEEYTFKVTRVKVTPRDQRMVDNLNGYYGNRCGKSKAWQLAVEQDITYTNGCVTLNIVVPNIATELLKFETEHNKLLLFMGHERDDNQNSSDETRPTSFQEPLVKCIPHVVEENAHSANEILNSIYQMQKMEEVVDNKSAPRDTASFLFVSFVCLHLLYNFVHL